MASPWHADCSRTIQQSQSTRSVTTCSLGRRQRWTVALSRPATPSCCSACEHDRSCDLADSRDPQSTGRTGRVPPQLRPVGHRRCMQLAMTGSLPCTLLNGMHHEIAIDFSWLEIVQERTIMIGFDELQLEPCREPTPSCNTASALDRLSQHNVFAFTNCVYKWSIVRSCITSNNEVAILDVYKKL